MANTQNDIDIISHSIEFMSNKDVLRKLFIERGLTFRDSLSYKKLASIYEKSPESLSVSEITESFRDIWMPCDVSRHIQHLKSGLLNGHDWHGAMPSILHRSIQDRVRQCSDGSLSLEEYLQIGSDIFKHEYFMVATHDICESSIILSDASVIPPIGNKSVTDFIYGGIPYDLKVSSHTPKWIEKAGQMTVEDKKKIAFELYEGADSERMRKMADGCKHNWGLNRMYYLVSDQSKWIKFPEDTIQYLIEGLNNPSNYFDITVHGLQIHICLIEQ